MIKMNCKELIPESYNIITSICSPSKLNSSIKFIVGRLLSITTDMHRKISIELGRV